MSSESNNPRLPRSISVSGLSSTPSFSACMNRPQNTQARKRVVRSRQTARSSSSSQWTDRGMMKSIAALALAAGALLWAPQAVACRIAVGFDPMAQRADVIVHGRVLNQVGASGFVFADIAVERALVGAFPDRSYRLSWHVYDGRGLCPPPGPDLRKGDEVVVYLKRDSGRFQAQGWMPPQRAIEADPFAAAAFAKGSPSTKKALVKRAAEVHRMRGPVPLNDVASWMAPNEGRSTLVDIRNADGIDSRVSFSVDDHGRVTDCRDMVTRPDGSADERQRARDALVCSRLTQRARFKRPLFPHERRGRFQWIEGAAR